MRTHRHRAADPLLLPHRRARELYRVILAGFVPGPSTCRIDEVVLRPVPSATVSHVAGTLDAAVAAFHRRTNYCKTLMPHGVVPARRTGTDAIRRPAPVVLGILPDGHKGFIDFQPARGESAAEWKHLPTSFHRRGLTGEGLEMIRAEGGNGLPAAVPPVHPDIPVRRCWAHRIGNVPNRLRESDREDAKCDLHNIMKAPNITAVHAAARRFADR